MARISPECRREYNFYFELRNLRELSTDSHDVKILQMLLKHGLGSNYYIHGVKNRQFKYNYFFS